MPTSYTDPVRQGEITTLEGFVEMCARAFGVGLDHRDEGPLTRPLPADPLPVSDYFIQAAADAAEELMVFLGLSEDQMRARAIAEHAEENANILKRNEESATYAKRYNEMMVKVQAWNPPGHELCQQKKFMLEQLQISIDADCYLTSTKEMLPFAEWRYENIKELADTFKRTSQRLIEQRHRAIMGAAHMQLMRATLTTTTPSEGE